MGAHQAFMLRQDRAVCAPEPVQAPKSIIKVEFGRRLQNHLIAHDMSQSDLARITGIGRDSISTYVNGKTFPTPSKLKKICDALGVDREVLVPGEAAGGEAVPAFRLSQSAIKGQAFVQLNRELPFAIAAQIVDLVNQADVEPA